MQKHNSSSPEDIQFWERMDYLIGEERPYPWSERIGLNRSAFQSARTRCKKPLPKTLKIWAEKIGCSYEWLASGTGQPFEHNAPLASLNNTVSTQSIHLNQQPVLSVNYDLLFEAIVTAESALNITQGVMLPEKKAEFIVSLYFTGAKEDKTEKLLRACITLIEQALKDTRRIMSPKDKTQLILIIYNFYINKCWTPEVLKIALDQLIRSIK